MRITILQIGKTKHNFVQEAESEYLKRLHPYAEIKIQTLKEGRVQNNPQVTKDDEAKVLIAAIPKHTFLVVLDEQGRQFTSPDFSKQIAEIRDFGEADITFIIGGPYGLAESIKAKANLLLGFSRFTFTHEMIRILLLEQLYRSFMILSNKTYHF